jgi:hypothetical protein
MRLLAKSNVVSQGPCSCACGCKSSDASTQYADGSVWCFSCGHGKGTKGQRTMMFSDREQLESVNLYRERLPVDATHCRKNYDWLKQYIDDDEIEKHGFFYCPYADRHVIGFNEGKEDYFYEARAVTDRMPKSKQDGTKPYPILMAPDDLGVLVIVEDMVSAIKVSRQYHAMPLFGSYFPSHIMAKVKAADVQMAIIWLDEDKYDKAMEYAQQLGALVPAVAIRTHLDPKACMDSLISGTIEEILEEEELS